MKKTAVIKAQNSNPQMSGVSIIVLEPAKKVYTDS
jgi:hypothetical protein